MADSAQDKNLPASERKKQRAREDGQLPRSRDLGHFTALAMGGTLLYMGAEPLSRWMRNMLGDALRFDRTMAVDPTKMGDQLEYLMLQALMVIIPMGLIMIAMAFVTALLSGGWNLSFKTLQPNFSKLNPIAGVGRMFGKQHLIDAGKMCLLAGLVGTVGYQYLKAHFTDLSSLLLSPLPTAVAQLASTLAGGFALMMLVVAGWALIDVPLQRHLWADRLKMSREEVKQEHKNAEGNQEVKGRIKQRMREMSRRKMMAAVPTADLVVMNPTHYAVALKYDDGAMGAPRVVAKGADLIAMKIRDLARESKVPVLQAPPLARALYTHVELDHEVPAALFAAVAQVLAWVYQLRADPRSTLAAPQVNVPPELDPHNAVPRAE
jgi:flagellar biosynthetic protein FlhB